MTDTPRPLLASALSPLICALPKERSDLRGHVAQRVTNETAQIGYFVIAPSEDERRLCAALEKKERLPEFVPFAEDKLQQCSLCEGYPRWESDGLLVRATSACRHANGYRPVVRLNVPSGVLVFGKYLEGYFEDTRGDLSTVPGQIRQIRSLERQSCAFVDGRSLTNVFRPRRDVLFVARRGYDRRDRVVAAGLGPCVVARELDLCYALDEAEYKRRVPGKDRRRLAREVTKLKVRPGMYLVRHFAFRHGRSLRKEPDHRRPTVFASFTRVRPPDPEPPKTTKR